MLGNMDCLKNPCVLSFQTWILISDVCFFNLIRKVYIKRDVFIYSLYMMRCTALLLQQNNMFVTTNIEIPSHALLITHI